MIFREEKIENIALIQMGKGKYQAARLVIYCIKSVSQQAQNIE